MEPCSTRPLYQRFLKNRFDSLPPVLKKFHGRPRGGCAGGFVTVERGPGLRSGLARLLRLPPVGSHLALRLEVISVGDKERWIRTFGTHRLETLQWQEDEYLIERAGAMEFVFQVQASGQGLDFHSVYSRIGKIRVPGWASLHIRAIVVGTEEKWTVSVCISAPLLGTITTYTGEVTPQPAKLKKLMS